MDGRRYRLGVASAMVLVLGLTLGPAVAQGATASVSAAQLSYVATPGEANQVTVSREPDLFRISDSGAIVSAGAGCSATVDIHTVTCPAAGISSIHIDVGDRDDAATNATATPSVIDGGDGADTLLGGDGDVGDQVNGGAGNDNLDANAGPDTVSGGSGDDVINSRGVRPDNIACGTGTDSVFADASDNVNADCEFVDRPGGAAPAASGSDLNLLPQSNPNACGVDRLGTAGNDVITGGSGGDNIFGLGGNDRLNGAGGDDCVFGGSGADRVTGASGDDRLQGDSGTDILRGSSGKDGLLGGTGNDTARGEGGNDGVLGGSGRDRLYGGSGKDGISGGTGNDRISGGSGNDRLLGRSGNDRIFAGSGRNRLNGGNGNDRLDSRNGKKDRVDCGRGRDRVRADAIDRVRRCELVIRP